MWHIVGATSQLARLFIASIPEGRPYITYGRGEGSDCILDLSDPGTFVSLHAEKGDRVAIFAAISSPDMCTNHYEDAYRVNVTGTEALIRRCLDAGARVLFYSSDTVIGGTGKEPADEDAEPHPFGRYAEMKRQVEKDFGNEPGFKVIRLSYVYTGNDKFSRYLDSCSAEGKPAEVFDTLYRNTVYIGDVIDATIAILEGFDDIPFGRIHLSGPELLSRRDMAICYRDAVDPGLEIRTIPAPEGFFESRPPVISTTSL